MQEKSNPSNNTKSKQRTTTEERQTHVEKWRKSGLSMSEYCRQNNLAVSNLSGWNNSLLKGGTQFKPIQSLSLSDPVKPTTNIIGTPG